MKSIKMRIYDDIINFFEYYDNMTIEDYNEICDSYYNLKKDLKKINKD